MTVDELIDRLKELKEVHNDVGSYEIGTEGYTVLSLPKDAIITNSPDGGLWVVIK